MKKNVPCLQYSIPLTKTPLSSCWFFWDDIFNIDSLIVSLFDEKTKPALSCSCKIQYFHRSSLSGNNKLYKEKNKKQIKTSPSKF